MNLGQGQVRTASISDDYEHNDIFVLGMSLAFKELPWAVGLSF